MPKLSAQKISTVLLGTSISASSILSGFLICLSHVAIPSILLPKDLTEKQLLTLWRAVYFKGFHLSPPLALLSGVAAISNALFLSSAGNAGSKVKRLLFASLCCIGVVPYTVFFVAPTNKIMMARLAELEASEGDETKSSGLELSESRKLVSSWAKLNFGRFLLPFVGSFAAWSAW